MNKPIYTSRVFNFDKPIVYIHDACGNTIGYITMDSEDDLIELVEIIRKGQENEDEER